MARQRRSFKSEFKEEAVRLVKESGRPVAQLARELGVRADMLRRWRQEADRREAAGATEVFPGNGKLTGEAEEIRKLRRELEVVRQERDFLKKAAAYFAKESK